MIYNRSTGKCLTNHWRRIVDPAGATISQLKRYI